MQVPCPPVTRRCPRLDLRVLRCPTPIMLFPQHDSVTTGPLLPMTHSPDLCSTLTPITTMALVTLVWQRGSRPGSMRPPEGGYPNKMETGGF